MDSINSTQLYNIVVETQSGKRLGVLRDFDLERGTLRVLTLHVAPTSFIKKLTRSHLLIPATAILEVHNDMIVVEDAVVQEVATVGGEEEKVSAQTVPSALTQSDL